MTSRNAQSVEPLQHHSTTGEEEKQKLLEQLKIANSLRFTHRPKKNHTPNKHQHMKKQTNQQRILLDKTGGSSITVRHPFFMEFIKRYQREKASANRGKADSTLLNSDRPKGGA